MCTQTSRLDLVVRVGPKVDDQLRYTLRSLSRNLPHARIVTAGCKPYWTTCDHIDVPMVAGKYGHAYAVLQAIIETDWLTPSVVIADDDMFLIQPIESLPEYHRGPLADIVPIHHRRTAWQDTLAANPDALCRDLHVPTVVDRARLTTELGAIPYSQRDRIWWRTLHGGGCTKIDDVKVRDRQPIQGDPLWLSTSDHSWRGPAGQWVRQQFPEKCRAET